MEIAKKPGLSQDDKLVLWLLAGTIVLMNIPYGQYPLYPFKLFATWIHECFHGLAALVSGGSVQSVEIFTDTSGVTRSVLPRSTAAAALVSTMGYMGTSIVGAILLVMRNKPSLQRWALVVIALGMVLSIVFWIRNGFGLGVTAALAVAIGFLALRASNRFASIATSVLASQACVNAVLDIRVLYSVSGQSDAAAMANTVGLWPWFWASLWLLLSGALFWLAWSRSTGRART
jgi:hypothetical protein